MKRFVFISVAFALILCACGTESASAPIPAPTEESLPVIQVDAEHMINPSLAYEIPAGPGFVLDVTGFDFGTPQEPTMLQVVLDGRAFTGTWKSGQPLQTVRAEALLPPPGFNPLSGFPSGKQLIIAVGWVSDNGRFEPLWVAVANVR